MSSIVKVIINKGDTSITIEGPQDFVEKQVALFSGISSNQLIEKSEISEYMPANIRTFVQEKNPKGHHEIVAVMAFFLHLQGVEEFSESDIKRAYIQAGVRPPKVVGQSLRDAKSKFDYIEVGSKRGLYKLSHHGDRTVRFDLPR